MFEKQSDNALPVVMVSDREAIRALQFIAASTGGNTAQLSGSCQLPRKVRLMAYAAWEKTASVVAAVRCRRCPNCLKYRASKWSQKGIVEVRASQRTWFGTLTVRPETRFQYRMLTEHRLTEGGQQVDSASARYFREHVKDLGREITLFIKRVRKNSGARMRYLLVAERHKDGYPHFHVLIHEVHGSAPVTKAILEKAWQAGFSNWRLVSQDQPKVVYYVTKYLTKSALTRVRASFRYGRDAERRLTELIWEATRLVSQ